MLSGATIATLWPNPATLPWGAAAYMSLHFPQLEDWFCLLILPAHLVALGLNCQVLLRLRVAT